MHRKQPITNWQDYWKQFDEMVHSLEDKGHLLLVVDLKEAQSYVNGMTDGWFEFVVRFQQALDRAVTGLPVDDLVVAKDLLDYVKTILKR